MGLQICRRGRQGGTEGAAPRCSLLPLSFQVLCLCGGLRHGDQGMDALHLPGMLRMDSARYVLYFSASPRATRALSGCSRYPVRCFSLLAVLETPLTTSPCKALQPELEKHFTGQASPRGAGCRRGAVGEMRAQPGSLQVAVYPSSKGVKGSQLAEQDPGMLPSLPHPRKEQMLVLHAGAPLAQASHEWCVG